MKEFNTTKGEWIDENNSDERVPSISISQSHIPVKPQTVPIIEPQSEPSCLVSQPTSDQSHVAVTFSIRINIYPMTLALGVLGCLYGVYKFISNDQT